LLALLERRIADRSVLALIRAWLEAPVQEEDECGGQRRTKPAAGTPQGGVISPLLANVYLHELDRAWHEPGGPRSRWNARLVRYADDFVVLARFIGRPIEQFLEELLEGRLGLRLNRDKTRVVELRDEGASLDFLGYTFRYERYRRGGPGRRKLVLHPSKKAEARLREKVRAVTRRGLNRPLPALVAELNRVVGGWGRYFVRARTQRVFARVDWYVGGCVQRNLHRRSQRPYRLPQGQTLYAHLRAAKLVRLAGCCGVRGRG